MQKVQKIKPNRVCEEKVWQIAGRGRKYHLRVGGGDILSEPIPIQTTDIWSEKAILIHILFQKWYPPYSSYSTHPVPVPFKHTSPPTCTHYILLLSSFCTFLSAIFHDFSKRQFFFLINTVSGVTFPVQLWTVYLNLRTSPSDRKFSLEICLKC